MNALFAIFDPDTGTADIFWFGSFLALLVVGIISIAVSRPAKFGWLVGVAWIATSLIPLGLCFLTGD